MGYKPWRDQTLSIPYTVIVMLTMIETNLKTLFLNLNFGNKLLNYLIQGQNK